MTVFKDCVLLANCRPEKGFDLLLELAQLCPKQNFVALANQSDPEIANSKIVELGLNNVVVHPRLDDMNDAYRCAKMVIVPSFRFIETFSRICIEAQRYGLPVIGSNVGNIPYLLEKSGIILPENGILWSNEIIKLFEDSEYYKMMSQASLANAEIYSQKRQKVLFNNVVRGTEDSLLVGIGSGLGNMLHVGPMLRNIGKRTSYKIDLVVAEDHKETLFLLHNSDFVNMVFTLGPSILRKRYKRVLLTHSFGSARPTFNAEQVYWSRDVEIFRPGVSSHETIFNLEIANKLLGVPFDADDVLGHFVGEMRYKSGSNGVIGFHGGSKGGYWSSKRWPAFSSLAELLRRDGWRVLSFGLNEEYVAGTEDFTGGSISEMIENMRQCSLFVSNDSGLMNIASALGLPIVALFGPTDVKTRAPLGDRCQVIGVEKECAPCEVHDPDKFTSGNCKCIDEISVESVYNAVIDLAKRFDCN